MRAYVYVCVYVRARVRACACALRCAAMRVGVRVRRWRAPAGGGAKEVLRSQDEQPARESGEPIMSCQRAHDCQS